MKRIKLKNNIYIGKDSFGTLIRFDVYKDNNGYNINLNILRD